MLLVAVVVGVLVWRAAAAAGGSDGVSTGAGVGASQVSHQLQQQQREAVRVFTMQRGLWAVPRDDVFLRYNFSSSQTSLDVFTICYRIRLERLALYDIHISYATSDEDSNAIVFYNDNNILKVYLNNQVQSKTSSRRFELLPEEWQHLCHLVDRSSYAVYWQGQEFVSGPLEGPAGLLLNGSVILGQEQDILSGQFNPTQILQGDITQVSFWDHLLAPKEVYDLARCQNLGRGNIFSLDTAKLEVFGPIQETLVPLSDICRFNPHYLIFPEGLSFSGSLDKCRMFGASLAVPTSDFENNILFGHLEPLQDLCGLNNWKLWVGLSDEAKEGVWVDVNTQKAVNYMALKPDAIDGGIFDNCMAMKFDGSWSGEMCRMKKCGACSFQRTSFFYFRGLCFDSEYQTRFRLDGYIGNRPFFRGFYDHSIVWNDEYEAWLLVNTESNQTQAWVRLDDQQQYPLGQQQWVLNSSLCGGTPGDAINLSLSVCSSDHFMCLSGACISHNLRCDLRHDCADGSDEDDCGVVIVNSGYRWYLPPVGPNGSILRLLPSITFTRFTAIDDVDMVISIEFYFTLTWRDSVLSFKHLTSEKGTILYKDDVAKIWKPEYLIVNLDSGQEKLLASSLSIATAINATKPHYNDVDTDLEYPGEANDIVRTDHYIASVSCAFELYRYPFDTQICSLDIQLLSIYEKHVRFGVEEGNVSYSGPVDLARYSIHNMHISKATSGDSHLNIVFELRRRKGMTVMSTFVPSVLLVLVSWATLFVKLEALNVRAMMSLTTLLVLYTLFTNLSSSLPTTATIKLIDIWFFFIIFLLFANIIVQIFVDIENSGPNMKRYPIQRTVVPKDGKLLNMPTEFTSVRLFVWYRKFILPGIIFVFNIIFWISVFA